MNGFLMERFLSARGWLLVFDIGPHGGREFGGRLLRVQPGPPDAVDAAVDQLVQLRPGKTAVRHDPGHFGEEDRVARIVFVEAPDRGRPPDRNSVAELAEPLLNFRREQQPEHLPDLPEVIDLPTHAEQVARLPDSVGSARDHRQRHTDPVDAGVKIHILPRAAEQRHRTVEETAADRFAGTGCAGRIQHVLEFLEPAEPFDGLRIVELHLPAFAFADYNAAAGAEQEVHPEAWRLEQAEYLFRRIDAAELPEQRDELPPAPARIRQVAAGLADHCGVAAEHPRRKDQRNPVQLAAAGVEGLELRHEKVAAVRIELVEEPGQIEILLLPELGRPGRYDLISAFPEFIAYPDRRNRFAQQVGQHIFPDRAEGLETVRQNPLRPVGADVSSLSRNAGQNAVPHQRGERHLRNCERNADLVRVLACGGQFVAPPEFTVFYFPQDIFPRSLQFI